MVELLSPVGSFDCLKAAVQNGANSVYFGANLFSARAFASNFDSTQLQNAINYAKIRGVKTNLTLNTLIKNNEFNDAILLAKKAYEFGIDAIIVQDLGLARTLIKMFPNLDIHASTQMTVHNLQGTLELQNLGFKRVVLARELSLNEIEYICNNSEVEIECFVHGALCISYSGQCLFSSMVGGRSGNRGKCAQPCRLPFTLTDQNNSKLDKGFLLSTRDLCSLEYIPALINAGVKCFKIEGRMKSPEYVATVTKIYRKYIDLAYSDSEYIIDPNDKKELLQVFNRGNFSSGHLDSNPNKNLIFSKKPNNMGLFLGTVKNYNKQKGHIKIKLEENISLGDTISLENETGSYTISELMENNINIKNANNNKIVTIGRMKGNIKNGDKVFKLSSKALTRTALDSIKKENIKIPLSCEILIKKNMPLSISITSNSNIALYKNLNLKYVTDIYPMESINKPLDKETIIKQISKTTSSPFEFTNINVLLDPNLFTSLGNLNDLRRVALEKVENFALTNIHRNYEKDYFPTTFTSNVIDKKQQTISLLLNILNVNYDYSNIKNINNIYIPLKYFAGKNFSNILHTLEKKANIYIYLPTIIKANYRNLLHSIIENTLSNYNISGFVLSNISNFLLLQDFDKTKYKYIANYTFNVFNNITIQELKELKIDKFTVSPELDKNSILELCSSNILNSELIVYGKTPLMNINYCLLGKSNKCYPKCDSKCNQNANYYLKDRLGMQFLIIPDNIQTVSTIYNSKITSIVPTDFNVDSVRIDILNESIEQINTIIETIKLGNRFEGNDYTNGNLNREI